MAEDEKRHVSKVGLGMLMGIVLGAIIATLIFVFTNNALAFSIIGVFLVFGLAIGKTWEKQEGP